MKEKPDPVAFEAAGSLFGSVAHAQRVCDAKNSACLNVNLIHGLRRQFRVGSISTHWKAEQLDYPPSVTTECPGWPDAHRSRGEE